MPRQHGTGRIYVKLGAYYGRRRTADGRYVNRRLGKVRGRGQQEGLSRREAERVLRRLLEADSVRPAATSDERPRTVDDAAIAASFLPTSGRSTTRAAMDGSSWRRSGKQR